jgi:predicted dehydrogenase
MTLPQPQIIDAAAVPVLRWGVVGAGRIVGAFVGAAQRHSTQQIRAISARDPQRTAAAAAQLGIPVVHPTLDALLADPQIDAVYIGTPHTSHAEIAIAALAAGKHVLVEKPLATTAADARRVAGAARAAGRLAMEAMWTRYLPQSDILRRLLADGAVGEVHTVIADFGFVAGYDSAGRLWDPALGGGALLDAGVYPISFASSVLGPIDRVDAVGTLAPTGVDARASLLLGAAGGAVGAVGQVATSIVSSLPVRATVVGSAGRIDLPAPFFTPTGVTLTLGSIGGETTETWRDERFTDAYDALSDEATAFACYVGEGRIESPVHTLDETVAVLAIIEQARDRLGASLG